MRKEALALTASTASIRFSTAILQAVTPLFLALTGFKLANVALLTIILWTSIAVGSIAAALIREPRYVGFAGLALLGIGLLLLYVSPSAAMLAVPLSGIGSGLASSILAPLLHKMSSVERPFEGVASYSLALSIGLVTAMAFTSILSLRGVTMSFLGAAAVSVSIAVFLVAYRVELPRVRVELPSIDDAVMMFKVKPFAKAFTSNFAYSLILPLVLSYWPLYSSKVIYLPVTTSFALLSALFLVSGTIRGVSMGLRSVEGPQKLAVTTLVISVALLATRSEILSVIGLLLFSVPHALVYPTTLYQAMTSSRSEVKANYVFSLSSGVAEVLSPMLAGLVITGWGLEALYVMAVPLALASMIASYA
ncbi:MAG: hypothetical protein RXN29_01980 [Acidilobus sp.]|nr:hypothetical protein [Acidilobus sp.]